jgi:hypothetical protein
VGSQINVFGVLLILKFSDVTPLVVAVFSENTTFSNEILKVFLPSTLPPVLCAAGFGLWTSCFGSQAFFPHFSCLFF